MTLEAALIGPAQVHPQQDLGPVLRVRPALARVDGEQGATVVVLARELQLQVERLGLAPNPGDELAEFLLALDRLRTLGKQFEPSLDFVAVRVQPVDGRLPPFQRPPAPQQGRAPPAIVPEPRLLHLMIERGELFPDLGRVKDTSADRPGGT